MSLNDNIADTLTRIRNAQKSKHLSLGCLFSKMNVNILKVLKEEGFISSFVVEGEGSKKVINVDLKYLPNGNPVIQEIQRVSKSGRRVYSSISSLKEYYNNMGVYILSTSKGVLSDKVAKKLGVGGEVVCKVF